MIATLYRRQPAAVTVAIAVQLDPLTIALASLLLWCIAGLAVTFTLLTVTAAPVAYIPALITALNSLFSVLELLYREVRCDRQK